MTTHCKYQEFGPDGCDCKNELTMWYKCKHTSDASECSYSKCIYDCWDCDEMYVYHRHGEAIIGCKKQHKTSDKKECDDFH